ncbi:hypothetical protein BDZ91DRAFT_851794 [Kalaharituber pfeilii]|nr:hypothetical protein BDZ91DRAFT_851794 [Kalaharituber pfeilii]
MSDPLSLATSIAGLVVISTKIISMLRDLYQCTVRAKQAPESINHLMEEMQDMNAIFCQVQLLILGTSQVPNQSRLKMLSIHHLVTTLSGCVLIASNLDKYLSEVVGITGSDPNCVQPPAKKTSLLFEKIKWAMWKETEVTVFIEDLQRHKLSLSLMLGIIQCHTTAEASERLGKLEEVVDAISTQLRELITRHDAQIRDEIESSKLDNRSKIISILPRPGNDNSEQPLSTIKDDRVPKDDDDDEASFRTAATSVNKLSLRSMGSDKIPNDNDDASSFRTAATSLSKLSLQSMRSDKVPTDDDAASFRTAATSRSTLSLRSIRSTLSLFMDELRDSRPYKRIKRWGISDDSFSAFSSRSSTRGCSWSMRSDMSLGDLAISEISVIMLPICLSDLWDSEPYQAEVPLHSAAGRYRSFQKLKLTLSSLRGIHYAIREGNENAVQDLLTSGMDIEERDSKGRTPLGHAAYMGHERISKLLLERGARMEGIIHSAIHGAMRMSSKPYSHSEQT